MAKINSFVADLRADFPAITFVEDDDFYWSPSTTSIHIDASAPETEKTTLLHELAHAVLSHQQFNRDIELLRIEREAWEYVRSTLGPRYKVPVSDEEIESMIDTYRDWLHARSTCPVCTMTGAQTGNTTYHCVGCDHDWRVNDARRCGLKRYSLKT